MTSTTTTTLPETGGAAAAAGRKPRAADKAPGAAGAWATVERILKPIASLKLTVALFAMSIFITYAGTVAQMRHGIWTVVDEYFRTAIAWINIDSLLLYAFEIPGPETFPFPGGWLIGTLLLLNLLAAHTIRFTVKARGRDLMLGLIILAIGIGLTWMVLAGYLTSDVAATTTDAFWRVLWRLLQGLIAAVILFAGCWFLFKKRAGIVLLHAGIIMLLLSELITGLFAVEANMVLQEGDSANFVDVAREFELAVIDPSNPEQDVTTVVPVTQDLTSGQRITHADLPFDIQVEQWMVNSTIPIEMGRVGPVMQAENKATAGEGRNWLVRPREEGAGVDADAGEDAPAAYVTFYEKGTDTSLGTYLVSLWFYPNFSMRQLDLPQTVATAGGKQYKVYLRNEREFLRSDPSHEPFTVRLLDFRHELYPGTQRPKDFSSFIHLSDPSRDVERDSLRIWMNNPLRYGGRTFYQSAFLRGDTGTVLQVVKNVGWMVPYVSCMIVAVGMGAHFWGYLSEFLRKRVAA